MTQHKHDENCIPLKCVRQYAQRITGQKYPKKWIYNQDELRTYFCGEKYKMCIDLGILTGYIIEDALRRCKVDKSVLLKLLDKARSQGIYENAIERESGIGHATLWHYKRGSILLSQEIYKRIADAIDKLLEEKQRNER